MEKPLKKFNENDLKKFISRYQTALFTLKNYKHLHETLDPEIHKGKNETNAKIRNSLAWILGGNMEEIHLFFGIVTLYSLFENAKQGDTVSISSIISNIEHDGLITDRLFLEGVKCKIDQLNEDIKKLRTLRDHLSHNFKEGKNIAYPIEPLNTKVIEDVLDYIGLLLNGICSQLNIPETHFETFSDEISDDYRKLFYFLSKELTTRQIMMSKDSDSEKIKKLNILYHLNF